MAKKIKYNDGIYYIIKYIKKFAKHIFQSHSYDTLLDQEKDCDFTVDAAFREKVAYFLKNK